MLANTSRNGAKIAKQQIRESRVLLKESQSNGLAYYVLDREFDAATVEQVETLQDALVFDSSGPPLRLNRLPGETQTVYTPKVKVSTKVKYTKLIDKEFTHQADFLIEKLDTKGNIYHQVTCRVEWESLIVSGKTDTVLRVSLSCGVKPCFNIPVYLKMTSGIATAV